ncbi:MAG: DNA polymerase III subunit beta [Bacteroides sp.]|nr:DNA polymerase III subunit beta [Barnesiella sp.]MBD5344212.1 DNA polymerase III subunit beta [Bacteroides sp.]MBD5368871.1 DNA polymerase III subunit beta [Bacteroides sp.]MDE5828952.1 DNA polymerase III subunit beta [Duncaniella sp.]
MKFSVPSKSLHSYASSVSKVINAKNALTILNNFLLEISGNMLTITACDGENTLCARVPILDVEGEGEICIDARRLVDLLRVMPEQELHFDIDDTTLAVEMSHPNGSYKFVGTPGVEYPRFKRAASEEDMKFNVPSEKILRGLEYTGFAAGTDTLRPQMMGVYWDVMPDALIFVATDTHKLVKYKDSSIVSGIKGSFILPNKSTNVFKSVFTKDESLTVTIRPQQGVTFETDTFTFDSRIVKGSFPDYNRVIPTSNPYVMTVDRQLFSTAVKRVSLFVDEGHGLLKFKVQPESVIIKASDNEYNTSGEEKLTCDFTGNNIVIGFSSTYLSDLVGVLWTDEILFKLADPSRPAVIVPSEDKPDTELTMLLMPMNVTDF